MDYKYIIEEYQDIKFKLSKVEELKNRQNDALRTIQGGVKRVLNILHKIEYNLIYYKYELKDREKLGIIKSHYYNDLVLVKKTKNKLFRFVMRSRYSEGYNDYDMRFPKVYLSMSDDEINKTHTEWVKNKIKCVLRNDSLNTLI